MNLIGNFTITLFLYFLVLNEGIFVNSKNLRKKRGVMDNFNDGLRYAGQMFGIKTAADVANLVAKAFSAAATRKHPEFISSFQQYDRVEDKQQQHQSDHDSQDQYEEQGVGQSENNEERVTPTIETMPQELNTARLITSVLKMIGFDAGKLGALAINALLMIAQAIGSTLMSNTKRKRIINVLDGGRLFSQKFSDAGPDDSFTENSQQPRKLRSGSPIDWFLENPNKEMQALIRDIIDQRLAERLTDMIANYETKSGHEGACIKMLVCKSSPFIWGMQNSLANRFKNDTTTPDIPIEEQFFMNTKGFFVHLPNITEYREHGKECEKRFSTNCNTTSLYQY